jgi:hypothetical protein
MSLRQRLTDHYDQPLPAFAMLSIDSDSQASRSIGNSECGVGLTASETLSIPLRDPNHYRSDSNDVLDWLSRRWLFNIPRSRQVEGMRSLGRLVFVDHQEQIRERLQKQLAEATSDEAIHATGEHLGVMLDGETCDVFVVASVSGGTGGGAVLDAGYLIRDVLASAGIENFDLTGVLLHATGKRDQQNRIQRVNSLSCLTEFQRFSNPHLVFPGAPTCHVAESELAPFDSTYLIHLGDQLDDVDFELGTESVAEYLFQRSARPARGFFGQVSAAQRKPHDSLRAEPTLRTFGVAQLNETRRGEIAVLSLTLSRKLLQQWGLGAAVPRGSRPSSVPLILELNRDLLEKLGLGVDQLIRKAVSVSQGDIGKQAAEYFAENFDLQNGDALTFARIDEEFARTNPDELPAEHPIAVLSAIRQQLAQTTRKSAEQICTQVLFIADQSEVRLTATCQTISDMMYHLEETLIGLADMLQQTDEDRGSLAKQATATADGSTDGGMTAEEMHAAFQNYIARGFCSSVVRCLRGHVNEIRIAIRDFGIALMQAMENILLLDQSEETDHDCQSLVDLFNQQLLQDRSILLRDLLKEARSTTEVPTILQNRALAFLAETERSTGMNDAEPDSQSVEDQAQPGLSNVGGGRHVLAVLPKYLSAADWQKRLQSRFGNCVTLDDRQDDADLFLCCEVEDVRLDLVMEQLAKGDPTVIEMAARVHSRIDIDW